MAAPLVLVLAHDEAELSQQKFHCLKQAALQENCAFGLVQLQQEQLRDTEEAEHAGEHGSSSDEVGHVLESIAQAIQQQGSSVDNQRNVLLLTEYPTNLAELQALVDHSIIDGVVTVTSNDSGRDIRSSDGPKIATGADRIFSTSTQAQIEADSRFIQNIPPERLPTVVDWSQLVEEQQKYAGNWLNITVDEINTRHWDEALGCMADIPDDEYQQAFSQRVCDLWDLREAYRTWVRRAAVYQVARENTSADAVEGVGAGVEAQDEDAPDVGLVSARVEERSSTSQSELCAAYNGLLEKVPSLACTESIVVSAIVAAVTNSDELIPARLSARAGSVSDWNNNWGVHEIPCTLESGDSIGLQITQISMWVAAAAKRAGLANTDSNARMATLHPHNWIQYVSNAGSHVQAPRLIGLGAMPVHDNVDEQDRGLMETELMAFAKLPSATIHRCRLICMFDQILQKLASYESLSARSMYSWKTLDYRFHRQLSASCFQQALAAERRKLPLVLREYDHITDQLLLILLWRPVAGRVLRTTHTVRDFVRQRTSYEEFLAYRQGDLTPRTATATQSILSDSDEEWLLDKVVETVQLFPSDHSIITITGGDLCPSFTIDYASYTIGLRRDTSRSGRFCLTCQAADDYVRFTVGTTDLGIPYVVCTDADGHQLRFSMDGTVRMTFAPLDDQDMLLCKAARTEFERIISASGEVLRLCRDGTRQSLKPTGELMYCSPEPALDEASVENERRLHNIQIVRSNGVDSTWTAATEEWSHSPAAPTVRVEKDITTRAVCQSRSNGLSFIHFPDGGTIASFPDGTTIRRAPDHTNNKLVFIECPGLPSVEVNTNAAAVAPKETRTCFRCVTPDGTKIQNVAKYVGVSRTERSLVVERRDGAKIQISESGRVNLTFQARYEVWGSSGLSTQETSTAFDFDLPAGKFSMEDGESNVFEVEMQRDPLRPRIELAGSVEGVRAKPLISNPIPPRFFVMHRDGSAVELLKEVRIPIVENKLAAVATLSPRDSTVQVADTSTTTQIYAPTFFTVVTASKHRFQDGWQAFDWETRLVPEAAKYDLNEATMLSTSPPSLYVRQVVQQLDPVHEDDLRKIEEVMSQWERWKNSRVAQGTRVLDDHRSVEEQQLEATLAKQLRKLYKSIRANSRREKRQAQEAKMKQASDEMLRQEAGFETDSAMSDNSSLMGDEPIVDEEEIEVLDAFNSVALTGAPGDQISFDGLRQALVQALGRGVSRTELCAGVVEAFGSGYDLSERTYDLEEFRSIYKLFAASTAAHESLDGFTPRDEASNVCARASAIGAAQTIGPRGVEQVTENGEGCTPGRAVTHAGAPRGGWAKYDEIRPPARPAVGSGRNAVIAVGSQM